MRPTTDFVKKKFNLYNRQIFAGRLPLIPILICDATSFVGQFKSKIRTAEHGGKEPYDSVLRISRAFDLSEREWEDVIIHEMLHYFIAYNGLHDRTAHGPLFKALMQSVNENHSRSISISHRSGSAALAEARAIKKKWHVIAVLRFTTGELGVKVLPRIIPRVIEYHKTLKSAPNISGIELYLHNDAYFNRYPTSTGRRCHAISESELNLHLSGAHRLEVKGERLIQH